MVKAKNKIVTSKRGVRSAGETDSVIHQGSVSQVVSWGICVLLCGVALSLNLYRLGETSIWFDEAFSVELARQPFPLMWSILFGPELNMELYYLLLHGWLLALGQFGEPGTEFFVRLPSAIFAALSTGVVFALGKRYLGIIAGIVATILYLMNYVQLTYAQQARSYALQLLLICLAWYALFAVITSEKKSGRWWVLYVIAWVLATYAHMFSLLILFAQLVASGGMLLFPNVWRERAREHIKPLIISLLALLILIMPMLIASLEGPKTGWLKLPQWAEVSALFKAISGGSKEYFYVLGGVIASGLTFVLLTHCIAYVAPVRRIIKVPEWGFWKETFYSSRQAVPLVWALFCWLVIPIVISYIVSQGSIRLFSTRYLVVVIPPLCLLVGFVVQAVRMRIIQIILAVGIILLAYPGVPFYYQSAQVEDWDTATHWLMEQYQEGDGLVCYDNAITQGCQIATQYYLHTYSDTARFAEDAPGAFSWENFGPADLEHGFEEALDKEALALHSQKYSRLFLIVGRVRTDEAVVRMKETTQWLTQQYHLADRIDTPTVDIWLYEIQS